MFTHRYFLYDRKLLASLSRCVWESLKVFIQQAVPENDPIPGAVIAVQTFGDFLVLKLRDSLDPPILDASLFPSLSLDTSFFSIVPAQQTFEVPIKLG